MRKEKTALESYLNQFTRPETEVLISARKASAELGLEGISLSSYEAELVQFHLRSISIYRAVEIGTLTGLSALYWLECLKPGGKLWTFEKSVEHFEKAKNVLSKAVAANQCELILGDAVTELPNIQHHGPFDFIFIDGNKSAYLKYWQWAEKNISKNGVIVVDNVFLGGAVFSNELNGRFSEKQINAVQEMTKSAFADPKFSVTLLPTAEGLLVAQRMH